MANEWIKVELHGPNRDGEVRRYTIADATAVSKGTMMQLTNPRTVTPMTSAGGYGGGVTSEEKNANDGATTIGCWTQGLFTAVTSNAFYAGYNITGVEDNMVDHIATTESGAYVIGYAVEDGVADTRATVRLRL